MIYRYQDLEISDTQVRHGRMTYPTADVEFNVRSARDHTPVGNAVSTLSVIVIMLGIFLAILMNGTVQVDNRFGNDTGPAMKATMLGVGIAVAGVILGMMAPKREYHNLEMKIQRRNQQFKIKAFTKEDEALETLERLKTASRSR